MKDEELYVLKYFRSLLFPHSALPQRDSSCVTERLSKLPEQETKNFLPWSLNEISCARIFSIGVLSVCFYFEWGHHDYRPEQRRLGCHSRHGYSHCSASGILRRWYCFASALPNVRKFALQDKLEELQQVIHLEAGLIL